MTKILVAYGIVPFERNDVEREAAELLATLRTESHDVEELRLPIGITDAQKLDALLAAGLMAIPNSERVIALNSAATSIPAATTP